MAAPDTSCSPQMSAPDTSCSPQMAASDTSCGPQMELPAQELEDGVKEYICQSLAHLENAETQDCPLIHRLLKVLARPPCYTTLRLNTLHTGLDAALTQLKQILFQQYQAKAWAPPDLSVHPALPDTVVIQNKLQTVSQVVAEVMVDVLCGRSVLRGADIFAAGILAAPPGLHVGEEVSVYVDLDRGCRKGLTKPYEGRKVFVGNGVSMVTRQEVFCIQESGQGISGIGIHMTQPLMRAPSLDSLLPEMVFPQNLPSIVCSHVLGPRPGDVVLDMCAAPGGKTTHLAALMKNKGRLVAVDKSAKKIPRIEENCRKWDLTCVEVYCFDGRLVVDHNADVAGSPPYPPATFDYILLDAPCSALGQRPALRNRACLAQVKSFPPLQRKLLIQAMSLLKPGGCLVYSTCSLPITENEGMVAWALQEYPDLTLVPQSPHLGGHGWPHPDLTESQLRLVQRFDPCLTLTQGHNVNTDTIGFFIAKFVKTGSGKR